MPAGHWASEEQQWLQHNADAVGSSSPFTQPCRPLALCPCTRGRAAGREGMLIPWHQHSSLRWGAGTAQPWGCGRDGAQSLRGRLVSGSSRTASPFLLSQAENINERSEDEAVLALPPLRAGVLGQLQADSAVKQLTGHWDSPMEELLPA